MRKKLTTLQAKQGHNRNISPSQVLDEALYRERQSGRTFDSQYAGWSWASRPKDSPIFLRSRVGSRGPSGATGITGATGPTPPPTQFVNLRTAGDFAIFSQAGISDTLAQASVVGGDMGVSPIAATGITNFGLVLDGGGRFSTSAQVAFNPSFPLQLGHVFAPDYAAPTPDKVNVAQIDRTAAYNDAIGRVPDFTSVGGDISSDSPLTAGSVYRYTGASSITASALTINGGVGDGIIIQVQGTLAIHQDVLLVGGILPANVYWVVTGAVTIFPNVNVRGQILTAANIAMQNSATLSGRALAGTAVTLDTNTIAEA